MQTFLPLPDYYSSMKCLDNKRLGNQVWREGLTLLRKKWKNHPACKMWNGYEYHLGLYLLDGLKVLKERTGKDYNDIRNKILFEMSKYKDTGPPPWLGDDRLHSSHRSSLMRKNPEWYSQFQWNDDINKEYYWPVK